MVVSGAKAKTSFLGTITTVSFTDISTFGCCAKDGTPAKPRRVIATSAYIAGFNGKQ